MTQIEAMSHSGSHKKWCYRDKGPEAMSDSFFKKFIIVVTIFNCSNTELRAAFHKC